MYCKNCGNELKDGQPYCDKCGTQAGEVGGAANRPYTIYVREKSEGVAAVLSVLFTGLGQIYVGKIGRGLILILVNILISVFGIVVIFAGAATGGVGGLIVGSIVLIALGISFWVWNIYDAYKLAKEYNNAIRNTGQSPW